MSFHTIDTPSYEQTYDKTTNPDAPNSSSKAWPNAAMPEMTISTISSGSQNFPIHSLSLHHCHAALHFCDSFFPHCDGTVDSRGCFP